MKVGMLTQWFAPETGAALVPTVLGRELARRQHDVRVLTGFPNYPIGRIYPGYRQEWDYRESLDGVDIRRVPLYPSHDNRAAQRAANYLSFAASATIRAGRHLGDVDALWVYNSPAPVGLVAARLSRRSKVPYLLHVMDLWPDSVLDSGMLPRSARYAGERILTQMVNRGYDSAARIAVISPSQVDLLVSRGVPRSKLIYLPLCADEDLFFPRPSDRSLLPAEAQRADLVLMYAGSMGQVQNLDAVVDAVAAIPGDQVHLVFVGTGSAEHSLRDRARDLGGRNIHFMGRRRADEMGDLTAAADVQLVSLADTPGMRRTMPSKIAAILSAERAIVAACAGDAARVARESGGGVVVPPGDPVALRHALQDLASSPKETRRMGAAGHNYYQRELSRRAIVDRVENELFGIAR